MEGKGKRERKRGRVGTTTTNCDMLLGIGASSFLFQPLIFIHSLVPR